LESREARRTHEDVLARAHAPRIFRYSVVPPPMDSVVGDTEMRVEEPAPLAAAAAADDVTSSTSHSPRPPAAPASGTTQIAANAARRAMAAKPGRMAAKSGKQRIPIDGARVHTPQAADRRHTVFVAR
jgi:hypothetical protein